MRKILTLLTTMIIGSTPMFSVISCGTPSPSKIGGKTNVSVEFDLTSRVIVTDGSMLIEEAIFNQAKKEDRIDQKLLFDFFEVTDSENMIKPEKINDTKEGYVVLTVKNDADIEYTGSITIHFILIKKYSIDITQDIVLENIFDVTKYDDVEELYNDIWHNALLDKLKKSTPSAIRAYKISGLELPTKFNEKLSSKMIAEYNGQADTDTSLYSGTITIALTIISYQAKVALNLQQSKLEPSTLYALVWNEVKEQFKGDDGVSRTYQDYNIDWSGVREPAVGENIEINFLAAPVNEKLYHYIRVIGTIVKNQIILPERLKLPIPILVTEEEKENGINQDYIWQLAMQEAKLNGGPKLDNFDTTSWKSILKNKWPLIGQDEEVKLQAINYNTDPMFAGDIEIRLELINQGSSYNLWKVDPILLSKSNNNTTASLLKLIWNKIVNSRQWSPYFSKNLADFNIEDNEKRNLDGALKQAEKVGTWGNYGIRILGSAEKAGRDLNLYAHGNIKIVADAIAKDVSINLTDKTYQFVPRKALASDEQTAYLVDRIWTDIIKNEAFNEEIDEIAGISRFQLDWSYRDVVYKEINQAISSYEEGKSNEILLNLSFSANNDNAKIYAGKINVQLKLTATDQIDFKNIKLESKTPLVFIHNLPSTSEAKQAVIKSFIKGIVHSEIKNNNWLKKHPNYGYILWELLSYDTDSQAFIDQFEFPSETNPQKEITITIKTLPGQLFTGSLSLKIKLIYQVKF